MAAIEEKGLDPNGNRRPETLARRSFLIAVRHPEQQSLFEGAGYELYPDGQSALTYSTGHGYGGKTDGVHGTGIAGYDSGTGAPDPVVFAVDIYVLGIDPGRRHRGRWGDQEVNLLHDPGVFLLDQSLDLQGLGVVLS